MEVAAATDSIESRLSVIASAQSPTFVPDAINRIIEWLREQSLIPPKDVVIRAVEAALTKLFAAVDFPGPDTIIEPSIRFAIVTAVSYAYDQLDPQPIAV